MENRKYTGRYNDAVTCLRSPHYSVTMSRKKLQQSPDNWVRFCKNHAIWGKVPLVAGKSVIVLTNFCYPPLPVPNPVFPFSADISPPLPFRVLPSTPPSAILPRWSFILSAVELRCAECAEYVKNC